MTQAYSFQKQLKAGHKGEATLDRFFAQWYAIRAATMPEQRSGIDRFFTSRDTGVLTAVEYKTDSRAHKTGNAFVETISVSTTKKPGWAYSSQAAVLCYFVIGDDLLYIIPFTRLRPQLSRWCASYPTRAIPNQGYFTHGLLVPLHEFERIAVDVIVVPN